MKKPMELVASVRKIDMLDMEVDMEVALHVQGCAKLQLALSVGGMPLRNIPRMAHGYQMGHLQ